jgi:hypothetical protein
MAPQRTLTAEQLGQWCIPATHRWPPWGAYTRVLPPGYTCPAICGRSLTQYLTIILGTNVYEEFFLDDGDYQHRV